MTGIGSRPPSGVRPTDNSRSGGIGGVRDRVLRRMLVDNPTVRPAQDVRLRAGLASWHLLSQVQEQAIAIIRGSAAMPDEIDRTYRSDEVTARVSEVLPTALAKAKSQAPELVSANMDHAPQSGPGTAIIIDLSLVDGDARIIINVRPDGGCRPVHPDRIDRCGNIFDDAFERVLTAVILRATSARDPERT